MGKVDSEYLDFLKDSCAADPELLRVLHFDFWSTRSSRREQRSNNRFRTLYVGTIPSSLPTEWFLDRHVHAQRVGLYADILMFDDIVGQILWADPKLQPKIAVEEQLQRALGRLAELRDAVNDGLVEFMPLDRFNPQPELEGALDTMDVAASRTTLPQGVLDRLASPVRNALGPRGGFGVVRAVNRALLLQQSSGVVPWADDDCFSVLGVLAGWNVTS